MSTVEEGLPVLWYIYSTKYCPLWLCSITLLPGSVLDPRITTVKKTNPVPAFQECMFSSVFARFLKKHGYWPSSYYNTQQVGLYRQHDLNSVVKNAEKKDWREVYQIANRDPLQMMGVSLLCTFLFSPNFLQYECIREKMVNFICKEGRKKSPAKQRGTHHLPMLDFQVCLAFLVSCWIWNQHLMWSNLGHFSGMTGAWEGGKHLLIQCEVLRAPQRQQEIAILFFLLS